MKARRIAVVTTAGVITGGVIAGKLGFKGLKAVVHAAVVSPGIAWKSASSFASEVAKEVKEEKVTGGEVEEMVKETSLIVIASK